MTTIINPSSTTDTASSGVALVVGILAIVVFGALFVLYALPAIRADKEATPTNSTLKVVLPAAQTPTPETP
ncbi:hypothetical protein A2592_01095 [Candidatus Kaiserbacteria bacterium RIFOXYD1_FULL_42_15]|uniref:Uncharacterized protein n=1 Tax=Candidatus Kaiserbacteria bacterium RIFOXYD1_FULL_42_15 TaxID=1798532 RepID=A0A1F6FT49_9BACT|nr:MAG: hypothetical protein A2592_01095 [Candidatus Kaiserbacteria bacterium RIFOXYD1_FULL_42_15]